MNKYKNREPAEDEDADVPGLTSARSSTSDSSRVEELEAATSAAKTDVSSRGGIIIPNINFDINNHAHTVSIAANWPDLTTDYDEIPEDFQQALQAAMSQDSDIFASLDTSDNKQSTANDMSLFDASHGFIIDNRIPDPLIQQHLSFTFSQMSANNYSAIEPYGPVLVRGPHGLLHRTNSPWSDHITTLEYFLRQKWMNISMMNKKGAQNFAR